MQADVVSSPGLFAQPVRAVCDHNGRYPQAVNAFQIPEILSEHNEAFSARVICEMSAASFSWNSTKCLP
jgi:hypothetical protein